MPTITLPNAARGAARPSAPRRRIVSATAGLALALIAALPARADVLVFAAASTTNAITEIGKMVEAEGVGKMVTSFASSSTLAKQIDNGAPADIYVSANVRWMDFLEKENAIDHDSRVDLLGNSLALIAPKSSRLLKMPPPGTLGKDYPLAANLAGGRLALANPDHVPAGLYAKEALVSLGIWPAVQDKLAPAANVRAALALVARGEVEAGIVYSTDAAIVADKVAVIGTFPESSHEPIIYPAAILAGRDREEVRRVFAFLTSAKAAAIFARYGFRPLAAKP